MKRVKKAFFVLLAVVLLCSLSLACTPTKSKAKVTLDQTAVSITVGNSVTLNATVENTTAAVVWQSGDTGIATVDGNGKVTGVTAGQTKITATAGGAVGECTVTVTEVPRLEISRSETQLEKGKSEILTARKVEIDGNVSWSSSNPEIVSVENGTVTAEKAGEATVTATVGNYKDECRVTVVDRTNYIAVSTMNQFLEIGKNLDANYYLTNDIDLEGTNFECFGWVNGSTAIPFQGILDGNGFTVSNAKVESTEYNYGLFRAIGEKGIIRNIGFSKFVLGGGGNLGLFGDVNRGLIENVKAEITITMKDQWGTRMGGIINDNRGTIRNCAVAMRGVISTELAGTAKRYFGAVAAINQGDSVIENCYAVNTGSDERFNKAVDLNNGTVENVTMLTDLSEGNYKDWGMWKVENGEPMLNTIIQPDAAVWLSTYNVVLEDGAGETANILALGYDPENVGIITYAVGDETVIDLGPAEKGRTITPLKVGETDITVTYTADDVIVTAVCHVTVEASRDIVTVTDETAYGELDVEGTFTVEATATNKGEPIEPTFLFASSDETIATVDENGIVTAVKPGVAVITVSTENSRINGMARIAVRGKFIDESYTDTSVKLPAGYELNILTWPMHGMASNSAEGLVFDASKYYGTPVLFLPPTTIKGLQNFYVDVSYKNFNAFLVEGSDEIYKDAAFALQFLHDEDTDYRTQFGVRQNGDAFVQKGEKQQSGETKTLSNVGALTSSDTYKMRLAVRGNVATFYFAKNGGTLVPMTDPETGKVYEYDMTKGYPNRSLAFELASAKCVVTNLSVTVGEIEPYAICEPSSVTVATTLTAQLSSQFVYDADVTWSSSNDAIATVDEKGLVTGVSEGTATITATYTYNEKPYTASCAVTVRDGLVAAITGERSVHVQVDGTHTFEGKVLRGGVEQTDKSLTWSSSDTSVAEIDAATGAVTVKKAGTTTITASVDGGMKDDSVLLIVDGTIINENFAGLNDLPKGWSFRQNWTNKGSYEINDNGLYVNAEQYGSTPFVSFGLQNTLAGVDSYYMDMTFSGYTTILNNGTVNLDRYIGLRFGSLDNKEVRYHLFAMTLGANNGQEKIYAQSKIWENSSNAIKTYYDGYTENIQQEATYTVRVAVVRGKAYFYIAKEDGAFRPVTKDGKVVAFPVESKYTLMDVGVETSSSKFTLNNVKVVLGEQSLQPVLANAETIATTTNKQLSAFFPYGDITPVWASSDDTVATVDQTGKVTGVKAGTADITVTYTYNDTPYTATCAVTVEDKPILALGDGSDYVEIAAGATKPLAVEVTLGGVVQSAPELQFESLNETVATVDEHGVVTGVKPGTAMVRISMDGAINYVDAQIVVTGKMDTDLTGMSDLPSGWTFGDCPSGSKKGGTITVADGKFTMASSEFYNTTVTTYDNSLLAGAKNFTAEIEYTGLTVLNNDGSRYVVLRFMENPDNLSQSPRFGTRQDGRVHYWYPGGSQNYPTLSEALSSAKTYIMRVEVIDGYAYYYFGEKGGEIPLMHLADGTTAMKIPAAYTKPYLAIEVSSATVTINRFDITLGKPATTIQYAASADVEPGKTVSIPACANTTTAVVYASEDEAIATVDQKGVVTGVAPGTVNITATVGGVTKTCAVTVAYTPVVQLDEDSAYIELTENGTKQLAAKVLVNGVEDSAKTITYTSADESVATVDENGLVTLVGMGVTKITASTAKGISDTATVAAILPEGVAYSQSFAGQQVPADWNMKTPTGRTNKGTLSAVEKGIKIASDAFWCDVHMNAKALGVADNYTLDFTFTDFYAHLNNGTEDTGRYFGLKFAYGDDVDVNNSYQIGVRKSGANAWFTSYKNGKRNDDVVSNAPGISAFDGTKTYTLRVVVTKRDDTTSEARFYVGEVKEGQETAFTQIKMNANNDPMTFNTQQFRICRVGYEASSAYLTVTNITVTVNSAATL